jgi:ribosome modulation factor
MKRFAWVVPALLLAGCDLELPGQKAKDAAAMGYACRVSKKSPELCMRENPIYNPTAILEGWRDADKDVKDKKVDTNFATATGASSTGEAGEKKAEGVPAAEGEKKPEGEQKPEGEKKPEGEAKPAEPAKGN